MRATTSEGRIGPDHLLHTQWYLTAFEQLGIPKSKRDLFDIPAEGDIDLLLGLNSVELLAQPVDPRTCGFLPSSLSPDLMIMKSKLSDKLFISGTMGIDPELYNSNYPTFSISRVEFEGISKMIQSGKVANLHRVVMEEKPDGGGCQKIFLNLPQSLCI